jgi:hypothetical protein
MSEHDTRPLYPEMDRGPYPQPGEPVYPPPGGQAQYPEGVPPQPGYQRGGYEELPYRGGYDEQSYEPAGAPQQRSAPPMLPDTKPRLNAARLWAGGVATAIVVALIAIAGVGIGRGIFGLSVPVASAGAGLSSFTYVVLAVLAALVATGLMQVLIMVAPRPRIFFGWIVALATLVAVLAPFENLFTSTGHIPLLSSKVATALITLCIGIAIGTLLNAVARSSVTFGSRRHGPQPYAGP